MPIVRHLYPGSNTSRGFFSYYDQILPSAKARRIFVLKGGPGVGKSTLMRRAGALLEPLFDVEYLHCSSDPDSLDGICAPALGFLMLDGTSPHVVDPLVPGAVDGIVNLGVCLNEDAMQVQAPRILRLQADISRCFARAYRYLSAASSVRSDSAALLEQATDRARLDALLRPALQALFTESPRFAAGQERKMFAGAITPKGCIHTLDTLGAAQVWQIQGPWGIPSQWALERIRTQLLWQGQTVESYFCALDPTRLEHLYCPANGLLITTDSLHHSYAEHTARVLDWQECLDASLLSAHAERLDLNHQLFETLLDAAVSCLEQAKRLHDQLEAIYIQYMDYQTLDAMSESVLNRIRSLMQR